MLPGRTHDAVGARWSVAKCGKAGTAAFKAYVAECAPEKRSPWSAEEDQIFIQAHKEGKTLKEISAMLPQRTERAVGQRLNNVRQQGHGIAALREYVAEIPRPQQKPSPWTVEEDQTFIRAHKEGKTMKEITAMLPGRTLKAVSERRLNAKKGKASTAALREYAAECATAKGSSWSVEEDQTFIRAHREGKTQREIAAMLPGRTEDAVNFRWQEAKKGKRGSAALRAYAAEYCLQVS